MSWKSTKICKELERCHFLFLTSILPSPDANVSVATDEDIVFANVTNSQQGKQIPNCFQFWFIQENSEKKNTNTQFQRIQTTAQKCDNR